MFADFCIDVLMQSHSLRACEALLAPETCTNLGAAVSLQNVMLCKLWLQRCQ